MAVGRQENWLGQQRVDVPHLRALESATAADFDVLAGQMLAGGSARVVKGFDLIPLSPGSAAITLQVHVAGARLLHPLAAESGSVFSVSTSRSAETLNASNSRVSGGFTASATNYIGVDLRRRADSSTTDLVQFLVPDTGKENPKSVPLGRTLDYVIYISTQDFSTSPSVAPVAKVVTDSFNNIVSLEDARNFMFRLGSGGTVTDPKHAYPWISGRTEAGDNSDFTAGDKGVESLKDWMDAVMTRLWELGGGGYWYSPTADRNVRMTRSGATFTNGEWFEWDGTNLHWKGISFVFDNSTAASNSVANQTSNSTGLTNLADGECIYVDVDRDVNGATLTAVKAARVTLGTPTVPGSRYIIAWRVGTTVYTRDSSFPVGATFSPATNTSLGIVQLTYAAGTPSVPKVAPQDALQQILNTATGQGHGFVGVGGDSGGIGRLGFSGNGISVDAGAGVTGTAGTGSNNYGMVGRGDGIGPGVKGQGGTAAGAGLFGVGGTNGIGAQGTGNGTGAGVKGTGGATGPALWSDGFTELTEIAPGSAPATPGAALGRIYLTNNGLGAGVGKRQQVRVIFQDGTNVCIAESEKI